MNTLWKDDCFGPKKIIPTLSTCQNSQKVILWILVDVGTILANINSCFLRYWSHIHEFGNLIRRIFGIFRCPSFPKLTQFWKSRIWSGNNASGRNCPDGGRHPTKPHKKTSKDTNFLKRFQCISLWLGVYGWIKRSLRFVGVLGSPRNKNKCFFAARPYWIFVVLPWNLFDY